MTDGGVARFPATGILPRNRGSGKHPMKRKQGMYAFVKTGQPVPLRSLHFLYTTHKEKRDRNDVLLGTGLPYEASPISIISEKNIRESSL